MKYLVFATLSLFVAAIASSQSLADIANKEKKRREDAKSEGKVAKEYPAVVGTTVEAEDDDPDDPASALEELEGLASGEASSTDAGSDFEWNSRYGHYKVKYLYLENKMDMLDGREAKWCTTPPAAEKRSKIAPEMDRYRSECQTVRDEQGSLRAEMRAMQSDCLAEAKRYGVSPGEARLGR